uniref:Uncharacterized protein n=1 Tax=Salix viminalis TaxID=40686 RepID=A0A6N2KB44_SALVM
MFFNPLQRNFRKHTRSPLEMIKLNVRHTGDILQTREYKVDASSTNERDALKNQCISKNLEIEQRHRVAGRCRI